MFLFTHADDITGMSGPIVDARKRLQEEIIQTAAGTKDDDVLAVLNFIRKSLSKNYPFVQIVRPMEMDYAELTAFIENKLKNVTDLTLAKAPSLTLSAKLKLDGAAQSLVQQIRVILRHPSRDIGQISDVRETLRTLSEHIDVDCIRHAAVESKAIIDEYTDMLRSSIRNHISQGTKSDVDFNQDHIQALKQALRHLQELDSQHSATISLQIMEGSLLEFADYVTANAVSCKPFCRDLRKLSVWAESFEEFSAIYASTCTRITEFVNGLSNRLSEVDVSSIDSWSDDDIGFFMHNLSSVDALCEQLTPFPDASVDVRNAVISKDAALQKLQYILSSWSVDGRNSQLLDHEDDLEAIAKHVHSLEVIRSSFESGLKDHLPNLSLLKERTMTTMNELEDLVVNHFNQCCAKMKGQPFDPSWKLQLFWMQAVCNRFDGMKNACWRQLPSSFFSIVDAIKSSLQRASGELDNMSRMIANHTGMISGESFGKELLYIDSCKWIDSLLPPDQQFLTRCCNEVRRVVDRRIRKKKIELESIVSDSNQSVKGETSPKSIHDIGRMLPELREIDTYTNLTHRIENAVFSSLTSICVNHLESYVSVLGILMKDCVESWSSKINDTSCGIDVKQAFAQKLENILANVEALLVTGASDVVDQEATKIRAELHAELDNFKKAVNLEFSSFKGDFGKKTAFLMTIQSFDSCPLASQRIDYKKFQYHLHQLVSNEATKLETLIETTSDWDKIDTSLVKFEEATVLDPFVGGYVSERLHTLKRLREHKEHQVDDLLGTMIKNHDFKGIAAFLAPMARSFDQVKKQKFHLHQVEISSSLKGIINEIHHFLRADSALLEANSPLLAKKFDVLVAAHAELRTHLDSQLNFAYEVPKLRLQVNGVLNQSTDQIREAVKDKDFIRMVVNRNQGSVFLFHMRQHLGPRDVSRFEAECEKSRQTVGAISQYLHRFFVSRFEDGDDLFKSVDSLKQAKETGSYPKLAEVYETTIQSLESKVQDTMKLVQTVVSEAKCFDDMINYTHKLHRQLQGALKNHCSSTIVAECEHLIDDLRREKKSSDRMLELDGKTYGQNMERLSKHLDALSSTSNWRFMWSSNNTTYRRLCDALLVKVEGRFDQARVALKARDLPSVQENIEFLELVRMRANKHVQNVGTRIQDIRDRCIDAFIKLCDEAKRILSSENCIHFKEIFPDYRGFIVHLPCVMQSLNGQKSFAVINQLVFESLEKAVFALHHLAEAEILQSSLLRSQVLHTRSWGNFLADNMTLMHEEVCNLNGQNKRDKWLDKIHESCWEHFNFGRDLSKIKYCAILGVLPSSSADEINKAYKEKARHFHPDKTNLGDDGEIIRNIKEAQEKLLTMKHITTENLQQPFDEVILRVGEKLRDHSKSFMTDQRYDMAEKLLFELSNIAILDDLIVQNLNSDDIKLSIFGIMQGYVEKCRLEVDSYWSERNYKDLNNVISTLKCMERHLKAYPQIFPKSWDTGIARAIETEIESLGDKAIACLRSRSLAEQKQGEFRRCFIQMGFVLIEMPSFKNFTKSVMSCVLEKCLDSGWGYGYLFELGLSLQKGDDASNEDESRVAQMIVTEFSHFKEVLVMVWNEEVSQKPVEDVVQYIRGEIHVSPTEIGPLDVEQVQLLDCFQSYEREYKSLVGDYIKPDADLKALVHRTLALARQVAPPNNCDDWGDDLKAKIPVLLAGVFSLLTIVKSGASYNRIEEANGSSDFGEKLLMKPHNIQVLTVLLMLGCGKSGRTSLENQLMQIRTGEGKSIILGAASVMFALLGFKVRTVCYSEYLSDRDFRLFEDVFDHFGLSNLITYSKITAFAEDATAAKGDIRSLTKSLLRGTISCNLPCGNLGAGMRAICENEAQQLQQIGNNQCAPFNDNVRSNTATTTGGGGSVEKILSFCRSSNKPTDTTAAGAALAFGQSSITFSNEPKGKSCPTVAAVVTPANCQLHTETPTAGERKEILLVDEVDVFFGPEFYGQTYNQVVEIKEPEIEEILKIIWNAWSQGGRRLNLRDIQSTPEYARLLDKLSSFSFLLDSEISSMLAQVSKVDEEPYYLDIENDRIGYKVMDSISYDSTYGYTTCFAYLKESAKLKNRGILGKVLSIPLSCGQFSYANISPHRVLGVSGTLHALSEYEREILLKYGLRKFIYVPSVYGESNFEFDKAGEGIHFENNQSDFFHRIAAEITSSAKTKRAVIVFFRDRSKLDEFVGSATYRQLSRHKQVLKEDMPKTEKAYVISKAATAGQITLSTAVFGRGTDFFCKDEVVESNGGVHIIQVRPNDFSLDMRLDTFSSLTHNTIFFIFTCRHFYQRKPVKVRLSDLIPVLEY
jgi:hypothetical protein